MNKRLVSLGVLMALLVGLSTFGAATPVYAQGGATVIIDTTTPGRPAGPGTDSTTRSPEDGTKGGSEDPNPGTGRTRTNVLQKPVVRWDWTVDASGRVNYVAVTDPNTPRPTRGLTGSVDQSPWSKSISGSIQKCANLLSNAGAEDCVLVTVTDESPPPSCILLASGAGAYDAGGIFYCPITPDGAGVPPFLGAWGPQGYDPAFICLNEWVVFHNGAEVKRFPAQQCSEVFQETIRIECDGGPNTLQVGYTIKLVGGVGSYWLDSAGQVRGPEETPDPNQIHGLTSATGNIGACAQGDGGPPGFSEVTVDAPKAWASDGTEGYALLDWGGPTTLSTTRAFNGYQGAVRETRYPPGESRITATTPQIGMRFFYPTDDGSTPGGRGLHRIEGTANIFVQWNEYIGRSYAGPSECRATSSDVWRIQENPNNPVWNHPSSGFGGYAPPQWHSWTTTTPTSRVSGASGPTKIGESLYRWGISVAPWDMRVDDAGNPLWSTAVAPRQVPKKEVQTTTWTTVTGDACGLGIQGATLDVLTPSRVDPVPFSFEVEVYGPRLTR